MTNKKFVTMIIVLITFITGCGANQRLKKENADLMRRLKESQAAQADLRQAIVESENTAKSQNMAKVQSEAPPSPPRREVAPSSVPFLGTPGFMPPPQVAPMPMGPAGLVQGPYGGMVGPQVSYMSENPLDGVPCAGLCWEVANQMPGQWLAIYVNGRPQTTFDGYQPVVRLANIPHPGGSRMPGRISAVPYGSSAKFSVNRPGKHHVKAVVYTQVPGNAILQPMGIYDSGEVTLPTIPYNPNGWKTSVYGPSRYIDTF